MRYVMTERTCLLLGLLLAFSLLVGCSQQRNFSDIKAQMKNIQDQRPGKIKPAPTFTPAATFSYAANQLRGPFTPPRGSKPTLDSNGKPVQPNLKRAPEYLEQFDLDHLEMVGTLAKKGQPLRALILDPSGQVSIVGLGNHMGKNYGDIKKITTQSVSMMEIIPDGDKGWVQRARSLRLTTTANK